MEPKPIETVYNDYRFRSRLEARWAVFFDALGIQYEYENEGYDLGELGWYLPDFWLPQVEMWAEVKPKQFTDLEYRRAAELGNVLMLEGTPDYRTYFVAKKNSGWLDDYLVCNYFMWEDNKCCFYHNTEFTGLLPDEMVPYVKDKFGKHLTKGIKAAKSARFEHGETPNNKNTPTNGNKSFKWWLHPKHCKYCYFFENIEGCSEYGQCVSKDRIERCGLMDSGNRTIVDEYFYCFDFYLPIKYGKEEYKFKNKGGVL